MRKQDKDLLCIVAWVGLTFGALGGIALHNIGLAVVGVLTPVATWILIKNEERMREDNENKR